MIIKNTEFGILLIYNLLFLGKRIVQVLVELMRSQLLQKETACIAEEKSRPQMSDITFFKVIIIQRHPFVEAIAKQHYADWQQKCVQHIVYMIPVRFS